MPRNRILCISTADILLHHFQNRFSKNIYKKQKALLIFATLLFAVWIIGKPIWHLTEPSPHSFLRQMIVPSMLDGKANSCFAGTSVAIETMILRSDQQRNNSNFLYLCTSK